jgi:hypothetical protein
MALLKMDLPPTPKYDLTIIRELFSRSDSAAEMYNRIVGELEEAALNEQEIYRDFVGKLVLKQGFACKAIRFKLDLIVEFFAEKKYVTLKQIPSPHCWQVRYRKPRYSELYKREQRLMKFGPTPRHWGLDKED